MSSLKTVSVVIFSLVAVFALRTSATDPTCNVLHAAFSFRGADFFIYGDNYVVGINFNGEQVLDSTTEHLGLPNEVTAAVGTPYDGRFYVEFGRGSEQGYYQFNDESLIKPLSYSGAAKYFTEDPDFKGIDAAFMRNNSDLVYIAGCNYAVADIYMMEVVSKGDVYELGLPCYPDAAWTSPNGQLAYVVKGDKLFEFNNHANHANAPVILYSVFGPLHHLNLCPSD